MRERPILFSSEMIRAILDGRKTMTRRVVKPQPEGEPRSTEEWARRLAGAYVRWDRVITEQDIQNKAEQLRGRLFPFSRPDSESLTALRCPFGRPGDRLWVRETWRWFGRVRNPGEVEGGFAYRADDAQRKFDSFADPAARWEDFKAAMVEDRANIWRPSIFMPRWASRLTLEITEVRVERVQDISEEDAKAEGVNVGELFGLEYAPSVRRLVNPTTVAGQLAPSIGGHRGAFASLWDSLNAKRGYSWESNPWVWALTFRRINAALPSETAQPGEQR